MFDRNQESQINSLLEMSARIGGDPLLVQANTGNTSIKLNGMLWIKASGKWLAHARRDDWLVPVDVEEARSCLRRNVDIDGEYISPAGNSLKPSVETAMHSVIPQRVVIHVHSLNAVAWAVRRDGPALVQELLAGLRWRWIPYVPSGNALGREIEKALVESPGTRIFILANHGLVVCGESPEAAEALLYEVEERLAIHPRFAAAPDSVALARLPLGSQWRLPDFKDFHVLGIDPVSRKIVSRGILYPCQAIFFGAVVPIAHNIASFEAAESCKADQVPFPPFAIIEGIGVVISKQITTTEFAILAGLVQIVQRIDQCADIAYLTPRDIGRVLNMEAYRYRAPMEDEPRNASLRSALGLDARRTHSVL